MTTPAILAVGAEPPPLMSTVSRPAKNNAKKRERRPTAERFAMLNSFIDFTLGTLRRNEIAVWLVLFRDTRDGIARTGQADIARRIGASDRTVRRLIDRLSKCGLLDVVYRGGLRRGPSSYRVRPLRTDGAYRPTACPVAVGQNGALTADTSLSYIP